MDPKERTHHKTHLGYLLFPLDIFGFVQKTMPQDHEFFVHLKHQLQILHQYRLLPVLQKHMLQKVTSVNCGNNLPTTATNKLLPMANQIALIYHP